MTVLCTNSSVVYSDITAAVAAEGGTNYGVPTRFEQTGASTTSVNFVDVDFPSSFIYTATAGQETTGDISVGAQCTGMIQNNVPNSMISNLRTGMIRTPGGDLDMENLVVDAGPSNDAIIPANTNSVTQNYTNCIIHNSNDAVRIGATRDTMIFTNCTAVNNTGFGFLRPRCVDTVSLDNTSNDYIQIGASSSNYWADDGTGSNAITESPSTDIFVDYAGGDYRLLATSSPALAGAGAFIQTSSGITVTGQAASYNYSAIPGSVGLTGEITVTGGTANYNYSGINGSVELTGEIVVNGQTANYNYTGLNGSVLLQGQINVIGQTASYNYTGVNASVLLSGEIVITGQTANYDYFGVGATINLFDIWQIKDPVSTNWTAKDKELTDWGIKDPVTTVWSKK